MTYKGIIFDLDGTLLNTLDDLAASFNQALEEKGFPVHETSAYRKFVGSGAATAVERALPPQNRDADTVSAVLSVFHRHYGENCFNTTAPYPGIISLLEVLSPSGLPMAVLSNKHQESAVESVNQYFPGFFQDIYGLSDKFPKKPHPGAALHIAGTWGASPEEVLFLGDSDIDIQTAVNAGMFSVAASWGFRDRDELIAAGARVIIDTPEELLTLLK